MGTTQRQAGPPPGYEVTWDRGSSRHGIRSGWYYRDTRAAKPFWNGPEPMEKDAVRAAWDDYGRSQP